MASKKAKTLSKKELHSRLCRCIKSVRRTVKLRAKQKKTPIDKESAAIGICVKSVLHTRGKTIKRFSCGKGKSLSLQPKKV